VPFIASRPFAILMGAGSFIVAFALHFMQYASTMSSPVHPRVRLFKKPAVPPPQMLLMLPEMKLKRMMVMALMAA
jgi:hypothetical protein